MLQITGLTKTYPGEKLPALQDINLQIGQGEFVAMLGPSGAGKSTLIRCMNRLIEPDEGRIVLNGQSLRELRSSEMREVRSRIGMVFQHFHLLPRLSVLTNVLAGRLAVMPAWRSLLGLYSSADKARAMAALAEVDLSALASRRVEDISGGQKQRVAIARVFMQQPELLLGDEPVSSLDTVTSERVMTYISKLHRESGMTVVLNLHQVDVARRYAARIIGITSGRITFDGTPEQLTDEALSRIYPAMTGTTGREG
ncbi:phosphonate ABC transporter ATP-binding protein [Paenibacillus sp. GCM10023252]|uniref:phosphonate ABC transporter ATP-binding protein n=1 Tax=Paenibacillus sp. GCM10023252 TaxID=3252649 RepID=UPI0036119A21